MASRDVPGQPVSLRRIGVGYLVLIAGAVIGIALVLLSAQGRGTPVDAADRAGLSHEQLVGRLMLAIAVVILVARVLGAAVGRLGQPRVMGEVLGGILLGPSLLGWVGDALPVLGAAQDFVFPREVITLLDGAASIGLVFYMFLVGLELDPGILKGRWTQASFISNASVLVPLTLGIAVALWIFDSYGQGPFLAFALFMGVAMSITAFPVLARILTERRMLRRPVGATAMASAAVDDVTAWGLLALAIAVGRGESELELIRIIALTAAFTAVMALVVRRLLARVSDAYDEVGSLPAVWFAVILVGILVSAFTASAIGIAGIFGAFIMGMVMPRRADLTHDLTQRVEPFVVTVLLPLFFVVTGFKADLTRINDPGLWLVALLLIAVAVVAKWGGAMLAARFVGFNLRESAAIGALMNTRGLTELIVLNVGLELGVLNTELFTMMVLMAVVTTFMAGPALMLIDPRRTLAAEPGEEIEAELRAAEEVSAEPAGERAAPAGAPIVVALADIRNAGSLLGVAAPLATADDGGEGRELILAALVPPGEGVTGPAGEARRLRDAADRINEQRDLLIARGHRARSLAYTSPDAADDLIRLTDLLGASLLVMDAQRPLVGSWVPRGATGRILERASCDVAIVIERSDWQDRAAEGLPVVVPFGGADHDWAALELGALLAKARHTWMRILGAGADEGGGRDASALMASASLIVQRMTGIRVEPVLITSARDSMLEASRDAAALIVGLSDRWKEEGLGPLRTDIARQSEAPTIFVRRGARPGALSGPQTMTRMRWSSAGRGGHDAGDLRSTDSSAPSSDP